MRKDSFSRFSSRATAGHLPPLRCTYTVGDRVCDVEGYRGTVRYIGAVEAYSRRRRTTTRSQQEQLVVSCSSSNPRGEGGHKNPQTSLPLSPSSSSPSAEARQEGWGPCGDNRSGREEELRERSQADGQDEEEEEDLWIGVEWDDVRRGKHDGSLNGKRYFRCLNARRRQESGDEEREKDHQGSTGEEELPPGLREKEGGKGQGRGSFVKRHRLIEPRSFKAAVLERYTTKLTQGRTRATDDGPSQSLSFSVCCFPVSSSVCLLLLLVVSAEAPGGLSRHFLIEEGEEEIAERATNAGRILERTGAAAEEEEGE